ncbi:hypothetical protein DL770_007724 [Monosporascus sp. CRB-9-2]|nr:hypothetical protein DL770_007724 [Monosporascus sp. CRB-9-2]
MVLGGSTNSVLHSPAIASIAKVSLTSSDIQSVSGKIPYLADLAPSGHHLIADLYGVGGIPAILREEPCSGLCVAKITGKEGKVFRGKAKVFDKEKQLNAALNAGKIHRDEHLIVIVRYEGPKDGPGMPEQLRASAAITGANLTNVALVMDGRYSAASHGFVVGHVVPEAAPGGPISQVRDGVLVTISATTNELGIDVSEE